MANKDLRTEILVGTDEEHQVDDHNATRAKHGIKRDLRRRHVNMISIAGMIVSLKW